jgi:hypothetical protein
MIAAAAQYRYQYGGDMTLKIEATTSNPYLGNNHIVIDYKSESR